MTVAVRRYPAKVWVPRTARSASRSASSGAGLGRVDHDAQVTARHAEHVAVQRHGAQLRMVDDLAGCLDAADRVGIPQFGEPAAVRAQLRDQPLHPLVRRIPARRRPQFGDLRGFELAPGLRGVPDAVGRAEEGAPHRVALLAAPLTHQRRVRRVGQQRPRRVGDRDRRPGQPVRHPLHARRDVAGHGALPRRHQPGDVEQMHALGSGHAQRPAEGFDDLFGRVGRPALFQAGDVVDRDPASRASSSRRSPGARQWSPAIGPAASGATRSRRYRTARPNSVLAMTPVCTVPQSSSWYWQSQEDRTPG